MTSLQRIRLVAEREFLEYARQPSFRNGTLVTAALIVLAIVSISILPAILGGPDDVRLGVLPAGAPVVESLDVIVDPATTELEVVDLDDRAEARARLRDEALDVVVVDASSVLVLEDIDAGTADLLQRAMSTTALADLLERSPSSALAATDVPMTVEQLEPVDPEVIERRVVTLIAVMLALGQVMTGAYVIASGTVEEKTSRVIEVVVSKVHPRTLLTGKLVGLGLVLFGQLIVFVIVGLAGMAISPDISIPTGLGASAGAVVFWYLLAFAIYSSLFSIAAALSARQEDMAQKMAPMMYVLFAAFAAGFYAFGNPDALITRILTYVPFTAPAVLPARQAAGAIPAWEVVAAVAVTLLAAVAAVRFAGRVYTAGALRTRGTSTVRKTLQSADVS